MLSYSELQASWIKGFRNGNIRRLTHIQRAHYRACLLLARRIGRIVNSLLVSQLRKTIEILTSSPKAMIVKAGLEKAKKIISSRTSKIFSDIVEWLKDPSFIEYLGIMDLNDLPCYRSV